MNESPRPFLETYAHPKRSVVTAITDIKLLRTSAKVCCVPIMILLVLAALGPEKWAPRTELGWQIDHIVGYFGITLFFCFAWPRPFVVGGVLMASRGIAGGSTSFYSGSVSPIFRLHSTVQAGRWPRL